MRMTPAPLAISKTWVCSWWILARDIDCRERERKSKLSKHCEWDLRYLRYLLFAAQALDVRPKKVGLQLNLSPSHSEARPRLDLMISWISPLTRACGNWSQKGHANSEDIFYFVARSQLLVNKSVVLLSTFLYWRPSSILSQCSESDPGKKESIELVQSAAKASVRW
jgi:hypothetical protein